MSNERIDLTWLEGKTATREERIENICGDYDYVENLLSELKRCYEKLDMAESALTEIWAHQIDNVGGYNVTEILLYYEKAYGLNIKPEASD